MNIVIVGGGFGGLRAALKLGRRFRVTLIDKETYHLFVPSLYEIAATTRGDADALKLKKAVTVPYDTIFRRRPNVTFRQEYVTGIDYPNRRVLFGNEKPLLFDILVIAAGSEINYYNIEGLEERSYVLKDLESAVRLRNAVAKKFSEVQTLHRSLKIAVGGGGVGGVELAGETVGYLEKLTRLNNAGPKWDTTIIQASETILPEFPPEIIKRAERRLERLGVMIAANEPIIKVTETAVETKNGRRLPYDVLLWSGGIKPSLLAEVLPFKKDRRGRVAVNEYFCPWLLNGSLCPDVFVIGDACCFLTNGEPLPATAWSAIDQGEHVAKVIKAKSDGKTPPRYKPLWQRYIIPIKGKFAVGEFGSVVLSGFPIWVLKELVYLRYLLQILPVWRAKTKWLAAVWLFIKND